MARISPLGGPVGGEKTFQGWVRGGMGSLDSHLGLITEAPISDGQALGKQPIPPDPWVTV